MYVAISSYYICTEEIEFSIHSVMFRVLQVSVPSTLVQVDSKIST
jgi:hypothetical protein